MGGTHTEFGKFILYQLKIMFSPNVSQIKRLIISSPGGSAGKESACNAGDVGLISGSEGSPGGGGHGYHLQYPYLKNPMDRRAWWATPWGHKESNLKHLSTTHRGLL